MPPADGEGEGEGEGEGDPDDATGLTTSVGDGSTGGEVSGAGGVTGVSDPTTAGTGERWATAGSLVVGLAGGGAAHAATTAASATGTQRRTRFPSGIIAHHTSGLRQWPFPAR